MVRTWLKQLANKWFGGVAAPQGNRRRTARLGVEALERREVLSGNTAGYVLYANGYLYQQTASGLALRDTGVRDFTAPGGVLYDLHTDGRVLRFAANGNSTPIYANASALVSDATGNVFALSYGGTISEQSPFNSWTS